MLMFLVFVVMMLFIGSQQYFFSQTYLSGDHRLTDKNLFCMLINTLSNS